MKLWNDKEKGEGLIGGIGAMAGALLIGLILLPLVGSTGVGDGMSRWSEDDEGSGSLPSTKWVPEDFGFGKTVLANRPSFYLQGASKAQLMDAIVDVEGDRYWERLHDRNGALDQVRVILCGEVNLVLDASIFQQPGITAGLMVGSTLGDAHAAIVLGDRIVQRTTMPSESAFPVPFAALQDAGLLNEVYFFSANVHGDRNLISVGTFPGLVEIHQREVQG